MSNNIKILYVVSTLKKSGPTNQLFNLLKYLSRDDVKIYIITLSDTVKENLQEDFESMGVEVFNFQNGRINGIWRNKKHLLKVINKVEPTIIHTQGIRSDSLVSKIRYKKVTTIHNYPNIDYIFNYGKFLGNVMLKWHLKAIRNFDDIIAVSDSVKRNLETNFNFKNIHSIRNGVDSDSFNIVSKQEKDLLREKLNIPINSTVWIATGHLNERKNPILAINAFKNAFPKNNGDNIFLLLGDGDLFEKCKELIRDSDKIRLVGRVSNVAEYLNASDFFVSSSQAEGLPMAAIESLACGLPLILSKIDPHMELLTLGKQIGFHFNHKSIKGMEESFKRASFSDYESLRENCRYIYDRFLSAEVMAKEYKGLYDRTTE